MKTKNEMKTISEIEIMIETIPFDIWIGSIPDYKAKIDFINKMLNESFKNSPPDPELDHLIRFGERFEKARRNEIKWKII